MALKDLLQSQKTIRELKTYLNENGVEMRL